MAKKFLSGNEAFAEGIRLAKPQVISAYPITPQTIVVEKLSEMVEDGSLKSEFIHVEWARRQWEQEPLPPPPLKVCYIWRNACPMRPGDGFPL